VGVTAAALLGYCGWWILRADTQHGAPIGPDRLLADENAFRDPASMQALGLAALADRPTDGAAFRILGTSAALRGSEELALRLYRISVRRDPRDWKAHAFLMDDAFRRGRVEEGCGHLDAILRVAPELSKPLLSALAAELGDEGLKQGLADLVAQDPPWAPQWVTALRDPVVAPEDVVAFFEALSVRRSLLPSEHLALIEALARAGRIGDARAHWLETLSPRERSLADNVFDGGFEEEERINGEFAWNLDAEPGIDVTFDREASMSGRQSLRIDFNGRSVKLRTPSQRLALSPGRYRVTVAFEDSTSISVPFAFMVGCLPGGELTRLDLSNGPERGIWMHVEGTFEVADGCTRQRLWLTTRSRSIADAQVSGVLRLDDVRVRKILP